MALLQPGDAFPDLTINQRDGATASLHETLAGSYGVVLFYRGSFCPYCRTQLRAFQRSQENLRAHNIKVVALSVDDEETTQALIDKLRLDFPVGHSADAHAIADGIGAFVNPDPVYLQSTGFVLDPESKVIVGVWSNGAIGRLVPEDVIGLVEYAQSHQETAA
ncbi:peroxiredoxin family protein [Actinoplanes sp. NPDC049596]|uniref:peroxiredoxin family protein n=1 Tax=unclassified Actinoplanes TaxID=2626549 RepID=UPI00341662FE